MLAEHGVQPGQLQPERVVQASPLGVLFPSIPALVAREVDGFVLVESSGARATVRGPICDDIAASLAAGTATERLRRLATAHQSLTKLIGWLAKPSVPLTQLDAVRLDGFDTIFIELLGRCNERCVHCYADSAPTVTDALPKEVVFAVIDQAAALGFRRIQFTGGDPLLCDFLVEAVARASERSLAQIEIFTNGLALTDELADRLAPYAPAFAFSVYSTDPEVHDRTTRTPGSHRRTLAAIDRVIARGLSCRAAAVVLDEHGDVQALVDMLEARGVGSVSWSRAFAVGRGSEVHTQSREIAVTEQSQVVEGGGHTSSGARSGRGKLCITYTGDVVPCIFQRKSTFGNVASGRPLVEIIANGNRAPEKRGLPLADDLQQRLQCSSCRLTDLALGWLSTAGKR